MPRVDRVGGGDRRASDNGVDDRVLGTGRGEAGRRKEGRRKVYRSAIVPPAVVNVAVVARSKANSMMRRWRRRGLFLGRIHGARGQELAHILRIMCLFVGLEYGRPREGLAAQRTPERPFPGVHPAMVLHVVAQLEGLAAELALERPVTCVRR